MQNKYLKIMGSILLVVGVIISLILSVHQKMNWKTLMKENVEALTYSETENPYYPCIKAPGFCFIHGIEVKGVVLKE